MLGFAILQWLSSEIPLQCSKFSAEREKATTKQAGKWYDMASFGCSDILAYNDSAADKWGVKRRISVSWYIIICHATRRDQNSSYMTHYTVKLALSKYPFTYISAQWSLSAEDLESEKLLANGCVVLF